MKKLFPLVTGLCFIALSLILSSWATVLVGLSVESDGLNPRYAKGGDNLTFDLTLSEADTIGPGSVLGFVIGNDTTVYNANLNQTTIPSTTHVATYNGVPSNKDGVIKVTELTLFNHTGNPIILPLPLPITPGPNVTVDNIVPVFSLVSPTTTNVNPSLAVTGDQVSFHLNVSPADSSNGGTMAFSVGGAAEESIDIALNGVQTSHPTVSFTVQASQSGTVSIPGISFTDLAGNALVGFSAPFNIPGFEINPNTANPPVLTEVVPVPDPTGTLSPQYTFHSTQAGTINYAGSCGIGNPTTAVAGNNTITYGPLVDGQTYSNCKISVTNPNGEQSNTLFLDSFTVTNGGGPVAPVIVEVTPIPNPSTTTTPVYQFASTQAGSIVYGGSCGTGTPQTAGTGANTVIYSLTNGVTYSGCTIQVTNANGNSNILTLATFTVNTGGGPVTPVIVEVTPIPNPSTTTTPVYQFASTQAGSIVYGGSCGTGTPQTAGTGTNTVIYSLINGVTYSGCTIQVTNANGNSNILTLATFTVNTGGNAPIIAEITPISNPSTITTPSYVFSSTQAGTIVYAGSCGSATPATAVAGNNTVTYSLTDGQSYSDCTVQVMNGNGNSNVLSLGVFTVNTGANPPILAEVTPIPNPSTITTPSYVFNSTQPGTIVYGGSCGNGDIVNAITGNNTVTYTLNNGQTYNDCTIQVVNASNEGSNILSLGTFFVNQGGTLPIITEVTSIPNPSTTLTPSYTFNSTQAGNINYGGACGMGNPATAVAGDNIATYSLINGVTYSDCKISVTNTNGMSNVLVLGTFTVNTTPTPPTPPPANTSGGGSGSGKAGMRFSGQRRDDYARSGKFWDMSRSLADIERINQGYLGRVTTYINRNGFRVFAGYLPGQLSLDYLNSRIPRTHKFVYRGERSQRSGNIRREVEKPWETHPQTYFRNRWAHNAKMGIEKAVAFDPKEDAMKIEGGQDWLRPQWRRGGVWARDHVSVNRNYRTNYQPLPIQLPRLSIRTAQTQPTSLGVRRVALQYTVARGVSRIRPVRIESAASPAYEVFVTDNKNPWADDKFFNRRETLEMHAGQGTGERTIKIEMSLNPPYGAVVESSQEAWERSFLNRTNQLRQTIHFNDTFAKPDSSVNRVPVLNNGQGVPRVQYDNDLERWRAYKLEKANRINKWERRPYRTLEG